MSTFIYVSDLADCISREKSLSVAKEFGPGRLLVNWDGPGIMASGHGSSASMILSMRTPDTMEIIVSDMNPVDLHRGNPWSFSRSLGSGMRKYEDVAMAKFCEAAVTKLEERMDTEHPAFAFLQEWNCRNQKHMTEEQTREHLLATVPSARQKNWDSFLQILVVISQARHKSLATKENEDSHLLFFLAAAICPVDKNG